jgi:hypothetical protein
MLANFPNSQHSKSKPSLTNSVKTRARKGIPSSARGEIWLKLCRPET